MSSGRFENEVYFDTINYKSGFILFDINLWNDAWSSLPIGVIGTEVGIHNLQAALAYSVGGNQNGVAYIVDPAGNLVAHIPLSSHV